MQNERALVGDDGPLHPDGEPCGAYLIVFACWVVAEAVEALSHPLGISRGKGRRDQQPPTEKKVWEIIAHARKLACPSFAAWLQVAAFTGLRPGELDALRWERIDFDRARIVVAEQFSAATRTFDTPKNHLRRDAPLTTHAHDALSALARENEFCFVSLRGEHWTPSSRAYHWKAVRAAAGWEGSLYLATRHFAGWYMVNELEMSSEDAIALGHQDGGNLVRRLYGHRDKGRAPDRIVGAYASHALERSASRASHRNRFSRPCFEGVP